MEIEQQLATYIKDINNKPLLSFEQERELSKTIQARITANTRKDEKRQKKAEEKDSILGKAIEELTTHNLRLVIKEAFKFSKATGVDVKELIASGNIGLIKSAYLYDSEGHNTRFSTYATYWIRRSMFETVHSSGAVTIPIHILNGRSHHNKLAEEGMVSDKEIMEEMEIDEEQLKRIKDANIHTISMDQEVSWSGSDEDKPTYGELIADEKATDPSEGANNQDKYKHLYDAMDELDEMSRDILSAQILADDKVTLLKLGKKYGVTHERIRQIKEKALKALRKKVAYRMKHGPTK